MSIIGQTFPVLGNGSITLLDLMPHPATGVTPDQAVVQAARTSFMGESKGDEKDKKLLFYLMQHDHGSPFEQVVFKIRFHAPILVFWHLVRYREQSLNAQSGRYTEAKEDDFYVPAIWRRQSANNKQGSEGRVNDTYADWLTRQLVMYQERGFLLYEDALRHGVAKEQARLFLPNFSQLTTWATTINARSLMNMFKQRMSADAQSETEELVTTIYSEIFKPLCPWTAEAFETFVTGEKP
jgi:thymidylate synthase (FAD)